MTARRIPASYLEAQAQLYADYEDGISNGQFEPFLYPWCSVSFALVIVYLLIPHKNAPLVRNARFFVWGLNALFCLYYLVRTRMRLTYGYGGFMLMWAIEWTATILVVNDVQQDFKRLEYGPVRARGQEKDQNASLAPADARLKFRDQYRWADFSSTAGLNRLLWVVELFSEFRGIGWNWQLPSLPPLPFQVQAALGNKELKPFAETSNFGRDGTRRYASRSECLRNSLYYFLTRYLAIDVIKTIVILDPYFWGVIDAPGPDFLPALVRDSPVALKVFRQLVMFCTVRFALEMIFAMGPLLFVGLLGPRRVGLFGEYWMWPSVWGRLTYVFEGGLKNFWGGYWHQTFRFAFESISGYVATSIFPRLPRKSIIFALIQSTLAFALSGCLHGAGSWLQLGPTNPLRGPFTFFLVQPIGIVLQIATTKFLKQMGLWESLRNIGIPQGAITVARQFGNYAYTHLWLYFTVPLLLDDFATGGLAFVEPRPISFLGGLGLAGPDHGFWCWNGEWIRWHRGEHWWSSGIAL